MNAKEKRLQCELTKVRKEILTHGEIYAFLRENLDEDGEATGEAKNICIAHGLFHIDKGYTTRETYAGTETHEKGSPCLLCLFQETENIKPRDFVIINENRYNVVSRNNIGEYNIINDFSLEVVLDGNS